MFKLNSIKIKEAQKAGERGPRAAMERHTTRVAPQEIFFGDYFSGVFEVLIWALEPGSQRASCRNRKSALFLARNLVFAFLNPSWVCPRPQRGAEAAKNI